MLGNKFKDRQPDPNQFFFPFNFLLKLSDRLNFWHKVYGKQEEPNPRVIKHINELNGKYNFVMIVITTELIDIAKFSKS